MVAMPDFLVDYEENGSHHVGLIEVKSTSTESVFRRWENGFHKTEEMQLQTALFCT